MSARLHIIRWAGAVMLLAALIPVQAHPAEAATRSWTAYVADSNSASVTPIDTTTNTAGTAIPVGINPVAIAVTPEGRTAYVVTQLPRGSVTPIDVATNTPGSAIPVGTIPVAIAITPDGRTAYVVNEFDGDVTPVDTTTKTARPDINAGTDPSGIAITPDGRTAWITSIASNDITAIDTVSNTAGTPIPVGAHTSAIAFTPDGRTAYVTTAGTGDVMPIDVATGTPGVAIHLGVALDGVTIAADGRTAYVVSSAVSQVIPIDIATNTAGVAITVAGSRGMALTPDDRTAYVTNGSGVVPVDTSTRSVGTPIFLGFSAESLAIAITPDQAPVAKVSVTSAPAGSATSFDASASTVTFGAIASYAWSFGDGTTANTATPATTHTYAAAGTYTATVVETSDGGTSISQIFTGQTMSRNGGLSARASQAVNIGPATVPPVPATGSGVPLWACAGTLSASLIALLLFAASRRRHTPDCTPS